MTYKQQLIDLLKSDEQVKEAMEKLEFGCKVKCKPKYGHKGLGKILFYNEFKNENIIIMINNIIQKNAFIYKKIGLPLSERFIRMYCEKKLPDYITFSGYGFDYRDGYTGSIETSIIKIDNNLDFDQQSEETYKQIFLALTNLTNDNE